MYSHLGKEDQMVKNGRRLPAVRCSVHRTRSTDNSGNAHNGLRYILGDTIISMNPADS